MSLRQCESKLFLPQYLTPVRVLLHARWSDYLVKVHNRFVSVKITGPIVYDCGVSGIRISDANYCHCALPLFQGTEALPCSCADITDMHTHAVEEQGNQSKYSKFQLGANTWIVKDNFKQLLLLDTNSVWQWGIILFGGKECNDEKNQANYLPFLSGLNKTISSNWFKVRPQGRVSYPLHEVPY